MKDEEIRRELEQKRVELLEMPVDHVNILARNVGSLGGIITMHQETLSKFPELLRKEEAGYCQDPVSQDWTLVRYRILQVR